MDLYREEILDHYKNPRNFGHLSHATITDVADNVSCGDTISMEILLLEDGSHTIVSDIKFSGVGCAISQAAASLLTEHVKGKALAEVKKITPEDVFTLLHVDLTPARVKCALLGYEALKKTLTKLE